MCLLSADRKADSKFCSGESLQIPRKTRPRVGCEPCIHVRRPESMRKSARMRDFYRSLPAANCADVITLITLGVVPHPIGDNAYERPSAFNVTEGRHPECRPSVDSPIWIEGLRRD